jgi:hypothetical protein
MSTFYASIVTKRKKSTKNVSRSHVKWSLTFNDAQVFQPIVGKFSSETPVYIRERLLVFVTYRYLSEYPESIENVHV